MALARFGVSLDEEILNDLDNYVIENGYPNRSQAIKALIEKNTVAKHWKSNKIVTGAIVYIYDHHKGDMTYNSNEIQHQYFDLVLATQHFHLNHDICLEIIAVKGKANKLKEFSKKILGLKGVIHGEMMMSGTE